MSQSDSNLVDEVITTDLRWARAHREMDLGTIAEILSEGYRQIQPDGSVIGKSELLQSYRSGERTWEIAESSEHDVQVLGDVAIVIGRWRGVGSNAGQDFDYSARFLSVYVLDGGDWKLYSDVSIPLE